MLADFTDTGMTWAEAVSKFKQGSQGVYAVRMDGGKSINGSLPGWVKLALPLLGYALPYVGVVFVKGAFKIFGKSWLELMVVNGTDTVQWRKIGEVVEFKDVAWTGPTAERPRMQAGIFDGLGL